MRLSTCSTVRFIVIQLNLLVTYIYLLIAMADARNKASRIHRDLSMGNIMLVAEEGRTSRRGYLIDWEASCEVDDTGASVHTDRPVSPISP